MSRLFALAALAIAAASAQTKIDPATQLKNANFGAFGSTTPNRVVSALPGSCVDGETFFLSTATAGSNIYACIGSVPVLQGNGAAVGGGGSHLDFGPFTTATTTVLGSQHLYTSRTLGVAAFDTSGNELVPDGGLNPITVDPTTHNVTVTFAVAPTNPYYIGIFDGTGPKGDAGDALGTFFAPTKTGSSVICVAGGRLRYGTNVTDYAGPICFTLQTVSISSIVTGASVTTINVTPPMTNLVNGQAISVQLTGTGVGPTGCAAANGIFTATFFTASQFTIPANTSGGCSSVSGTVGAQGGGLTIIYGNRSGQIELNHAASLGALVSVSGTGGVVNQSIGPTFPNGSMPIAQATITTGSFDTPRDLRSSLFGMQVQSGAGIDVTMVGGQAQVAIASNVATNDGANVLTGSRDDSRATKTLPWRTGTGSPNARDNCTLVGEAYFQTDTPALWACTVATSPGTWVKTSSL